MVGTFGNLILKLDYFSWPVLMKFAGVDRIRTYLGTFFSIIFLIFMCIYASRLGIKMIHQLDPEIHYAVDQRAFNDSYLFHIEKNAQMFAFGVEDASDGSPQMDPDYIEWSIFLRIKNLNTFTSK